jgi:adenylate cyclase
MQQSKTRIPPDDRRRGGMLPGIYTKLLDVDKADRAGAPEVDPLDLAFDDLGEQQVKNIARPVRTYRVALGASSRAALPVGAPPLPDKPSLAVLPFQNMTGDAEQEYFVDGMVEEITTAIARPPWLFVIARNSSFTYKGKPVGVKQVAQELGVRYVLEGSVRKAGNRVRITGQLIDTTTGAHIWADRFDGALDDIFELQDQVASSVAGAIAPKLRQSEIARAGRKPTANLTAYDLCLRAYAQSSRYTEESLAEAVVLARQALAIDPSYAPAAAWVGWCRMLQREQGWGALSDENIGEACRLARQALEAEHDDAGVIGQAAWTLFVLAGEAAMAAAALDRALARNPNAALAWSARGIIHAVRNEPEAAIEALERARRLSPCSIRISVVATPLISLSLISSRGASNRRSNGPTAPCMTSRARSQECGPKSSRWRISAGSTRRAPN